MTSPRYLLTSFFITFFSLLIHEHAVANALIPSLKQQQVQCHGLEREALLQFKQSFIIDCTASTPPYAYPKMKSWREHTVVGNGSGVTDYCSWDGVECNKETGCVIGLDLSSSCLYGKFPSNTTIFSLDHLLELNLADNDFNSSQIPSSIGRLYRLRSLDLSESGFTGLVPLEMSSLSSLSVLNLGYNSYNIAFGLEKLVTNLTHLTQLYLDDVDISSVVPRVLSNRTSLRVLSFSGCQLYGELPQGIFLLPHIEELGFFDNQRLGGHFPEFHPNSPLRFLDFQLTGLSGKLPYSIGNLGRLEELHLFNCPFSGHIPASLGNLTKLVKLNLADNGFSGTMPSSLTNLTNLVDLCLSGLSVSPMILDLWLLKLNKLRYLNFHSMNMGNKIPSNLAKCTKLETLMLGSNEFFGTFPQWFANLTQLTTLDLKDNMLEGPVQPWLSKLVNIQELDLSYTNFVGIFEQFLELPKICNLFLSNVSLTFLPNGSTYNSSVSKLSELHLSSCNLMEFPQFLRDQNELTDLALDYNQIGGHVPQWFIDATKPSLSFLNLSFNSLEGFEQPIFFLPWTNLEFLDLSMNKLRGPLPIPLNTVQSYHISNNQIDGAIPKHICLANSLTFLDLSNNNISGHIPPCVGHQLGNSLEVLNLLGNSLHGTIPQKFYKSCSLKMINLSKNQLEGPLPRSLANCTMLEVLDVGKNRLNDTFPSWLGSLFELQVLVLRHNSFHGMIKDSPKSSQAFRSLRIIDLSHNFHVGNLPSSYLRCWVTMQVPSEGDMSTSNSMVLITYGHEPGNQFSFTEDILNYVITITNKGSETLYTRILTVFRVVDFSSNNFTGKLPSNLGDLRGLQALNLSNNNLEGSIPSSLSHISDLQSLDLSQNMFSGVIPQELSKLTFLEVFNVSHNHLVGPIPQGAQFDGFDNSSFDGNLGLCGAQLSNKCGPVLPSPSLPSQQQTDREAKEDSDLIDWIIRVSGCVSGFIIGAVIGKLYITDRHHDWFMETFAKKRKVKKRGRNASDRRRRG